jgi:hypothetical protein
MGEVKEISTAWRKALYILRKKVEKRLAKPIATV